MSIEVANPLEDADDSAFRDESEGTEYTMRELIDELYAKKDIILTIPTDQIPILRSGLVAIKSKDNAKLKRADISTAPDVLSFLVQPHKVNGEEVAGKSDVRVKLGPKKSVTVLDLRIPNDEF